VGTFIFALGSMISFSASIEFLSSTELCLHHQVLFYLLNCVGLYVLPSSDQEDVYVKESIIEIIDYNGE
jgi:hypothetical protein